MYEFPDDLKNMNSFDVNSSKSTGGMMWCETMKRIKIELDQGIVYPMVATHPEKPNNPYYSFMFKQR